MMPNGGHSNLPWGAQWFPPTVSFGNDQMQGIVDVNAFQLMAAQQLTNQYGAAVMPWNDTSTQSQWIHQWQSNFQANWANNFVQNTQPPPPPPPTNPSVAPPPPPQEDPLSILQMSEEEKNFDIQFKEWEGKFQSWKEENKNHPDKKALAVYEAQWKTWREQLIQNREKLRKQREEASKRQPIAQPNHVGPLRQAAYAIRNSDIQEDLNLQQSLHLQPQMPQVPFPVQHNFYENHTSNIATQSNQPGHSKLPIQQHYQHESGCDRQLSDNHPTGNLPLPQLDRSSRQFHEEYHDQRMQHSNLQPYQTNEPPFRPPLKGFEQGQKHLDPPLPRSSQYKPGSEFHDLRQRQPDAPTSRYPNHDYYHKNNQQSMIPPNQRELDIPQAFHSSSRGVAEPPHKTPDFIPEEHCDEDLRPFPPVSSSETAASLFRKRALRGKIEGRFAPYSAPEVQLDRSSSGLGFSASGARPRIEERLAEHADIKLTALPQSQLEKETAIAPLSRDYETPLQIVRSVMNPVVFEYNHRPGQYGRFATVSEPVSIDYSHGRPPRLEPQVESEKKAIIRKADIQTTVKPQEPLPSKQTLVQKMPTEKNPIKSTPPPLFPSAAAIQIQENQKPKPTLAPDVTIESMGSSQQKVVEPPKIDVVPIETEVVMVEDLLLPPGRYGRPSKIVVILRGLPGSGKSHFARLIKEKEVGMGGSAPRILSIDDYYLVDDGCSPVAWQEDQEERYRKSLIKSLKKNLDDGHFSFIIVDALHVKVSEILDIHSTARSRAFAVYLVDLPDIPRAGTTRKCTEKDLEKMKNEWQQAPDDLPRLDIRWLTQGAVEERIPTPDNVVTSTTVLLDEDSRGSSSGTPAVSKWELIEQTEEKLDRLDGITKRKTEKPTSMEDWLQSGLPDDYDQRKCIEGKKRVRWADVEEKMQQQKMRDLGFVVGQTDWSRMTDPTRGESALTKTKYI